MIRKVLLLVLGASLVACDRAETSAVDNAGLDGLFGEGEPVNPEDNPVANGDISPPDTPADPVSVSWIDSDGAQGELAVSVANVGDRDFIFATEMTFIGLGSTSSVDLGELGLSPGESTELSVSAANVPIQVLSGACQAVVSVIPAVEGGRAKFPVLSDVRFYRHLDGYESLISMTADELRADNGGVLLETGLVPLPEMGFSSNHMQSAEVAGVC